MNATNNPPAIPPLLPTARTEPATDTPSHDPDDRLPIPGVLATVEAVLRSPRRVLFQLRQPAAGKLIVALLGIGVCCSLLYGVVVGTFSGHEQLRRGS